MTLLEKLTRETAKSLSNWEPWIPQSEKNDFQKKIPPVKGN